MDNVYEKLMTCLASVRQKTDFVPQGETGEWDQWVCAGGGINTWIRSGKLCGAY